MILTNVSNRSIIADKVELADDPFSRMKGLLGRQGLGQGEALVITQCNSIHMFFMRFAIDAVFVDRSWQVVGLVRGIKPFGLSPVFWKASAVIELTPGSIDRCGLQPGTHIFLDKTAS
ncbi:MAG: DUF192 domain-containing protein [Candidatus Omnitrophica bacterium]|nr:DUF192 domain-containing protein [Candidatus Omnitrophota bacterium]